MKRYVFHFFVLAWILLCVGNSKKEFCEFENNHSNTELTIEHHNDSDQIYILEEIVFRTTFSYTEISTPLLVKQEYHNPIWKPPVNS